MIMIAAFLNMAVAGIALAGGKWQAAIVVALIAGALALGAICEELRDLRRTIAERAIREDLNRE